jgi:hypothetical protein
MSIRKGDVIDEAGKSLDSCRLAVKVLEGGGGFVSLNCCGLTLTEADKTVEVDQTVERYAGETAKPGVVIDESKNYPNACGLRVEIVGGGGGLKSISCCGNELTVEADAV